MKLTCRKTITIRPKSVLVVALVAIFAFIARVNAQIEKDPHRPTCTDAQCRKIKSFLKSHYCGESPFGNGPDDGCEIKFPTKSRSGVEVLADFHCEWNESKHDQQCEQRGLPSASVSGILIKELLRLGLPAKASGQTHYWVWKSIQANWTLAAADYSRMADDKLELCQVIVIIDQTLHVSVLRKLTFQKTDPDVPQVTEWYPIDLADVGGDGQVDVILEGDAYENHWFEVVSLRNGSPNTIYSGLGYYL